MWRDPAGTRSSSTWQRQRHMLCRWECAPSAAVWLFWRHHAAPEFLICSNLARLLSSHCGGISTLQFRTATMVDVGAEAALNWFCLPEGNTKIRSSFMIVHRFFECTPKLETFIVFLFFHNSFQRRSSAWRTADSHQSVLNCRPLGIDPLLPRDPLSMHISIRRGLVRSEPCSNAGCLQHG